ncbi:MAG: DUF362 domain-containing protein [Deltaproteobacteria bacterium]|nr:DUF362 domain-containing protein [Deltaproteobacteria bacterium]
MAKSKVAVLRAQPETILADVARVCELGGLGAALDRGATTILKDNISWHYPFPGANTTPWQLEGAALALRDQGYRDLVCVQNKTVVTNAFRGEDLNHYVPIFKGHDIPVKYNFREEDMRWIEYRPKARMHVLPKIFPEGIRIPDYFEGKNIVHLPTMKCVAGDTELMLEDGTTIAIRDLVTRQLAAAPCVALDGEGGSHAPGHARVLAMAPDGSVTAFDATHFARSSRRGRRVVRARTRTGRTLTATVDHPVWTPDGWRPLGDLGPGARVAMARRLAVRGRSQPLPRTNAAPTPVSVVARGGRRYDAAFSQRVVDAYQGGAAATAIASDLGVRAQTVQLILHRNDVHVRGNLAQLRIPAETSPDFWRWLGYLTAEGCVERCASSDKIWWVNAEPAIREDFSALTHDLFGLEARPHPNGKHQYIYSRSLGRFLEDLGMAVPSVAGNKSVPEALFRCPDDEVAAYLSAYLDGDGCVSARQAEVSATTKSARLAQGLLVLFGRLGVAASCRPVRSLVVGRWTEKRSYHLVSVGGSALLRLAEVLQLRHPEKARRLAAHAARLAGSRQPSNWDTVPLSPEAFRAVRRGLGLTQAATGLASSVNNLENGYTHPTPRIARALLGALEAAPGSSRFRADLLALRAAAHADLAWDSIESLEEVPEDVAVDLYDVTVPGADCFIANGLVVHNCHIYTTTTGAMKNAFGGLLNTRRHYTHSWIHRTLVDLLAIQKEIHSGLFALMDGTTAGNGPGPRTMIPVVKNYLLAAQDQVAIDAVAAKMMGFDPMSLEYLRVAHDDGLGVADPRDIELVGEDVSGESWGFEVGDNGASRVGDLLWFGPLKGLQKLFFHTPLVHAFVLGSEVYHDYYRWPLRDRRTFEAWQSDTPWGRLFARYGHQGPLAPRAPSVSIPAPAPGSSGTPVTS